MRSPLLGLGLGLGLGLVLISCAPTSLAQSNESVFMLHMIEYSYLPPTLEVPAGAEVVAMNFGPSNQSLPREFWGEFYHTVTSSTDRALFDVQRIPPDASAHPFRAPSAAGTYPFYCAYHGDAQGNGMAGTLVVTAAAATPEPTAEANETPLGAWSLIGACAAGAALIRRRR